MDPLDAMPTAAARALVSAMLGFTARAFVTICRTDPVARAEFAGFPEGFVVEMTVLPSGPGFRLRKAGGAFVPDGGAARPTLSIRFKHLRHALRMVTLVDDVPACIANDRLVIDGDLGWAMRVQRINARMMAAMLPRAPSAAVAAFRFYATIASSAGGA